MTGLSMLWLPMLLSSAIVFIVSSLIHMLSPWHKHDYPKLENEDKILGVLRPLAIPPGDYLMPFASSAAETRSREFIEKRKAGPILVMTVLRSEDVSMGKSLVFWFIYSLVVGLFAAYIAGRALPPGASYLQVFRFVGATAFIGYSLALWQMTIWYGRSWRASLKSTVDGLIYGLLTAGTFGWLWPR